jgi:arylsulfatase B
MLQAFILAAVAAQPPHLIYILADDFGWADADWHRPAGWDEAATPNMMKELQAGVELDQMYAFKFCAPSRSAIQSGRNPIHVNVQNYEPTVWDSNDERRDKVSGYAGIPTEMTGMAEVLRSAGYATHFAGKWDCGMATERHTAKARGYQTSLLYFHHDNDYWTSRVRASDTQQICPGASHELVDLWNDDGHAPQGPARGLNNSAEACEPGYDPAHNASLPYPMLPSGEPNPACIYEDSVFLSRVLSTLDAHDGSTPLLLFWAPHSVHGPLQVPKPFLDLYGHVPDTRRRRYLSMVRWLDSAVGNVTDRLRARGMYDESLIVFTADNGGPVYYGGSAGANNHPLRGGKTSNWQGGIRVNAWASGGLIPVAMRGRKLAGLAAVWDMYATFSHLAGADPTDHRAAAAGLPPIDSIDLWPYISGQVDASPRTQVEIGSTTCAAPWKPGCINKWGWGNVSTIVQGLIEDRGDEGLWKLLVGANPMNGWQGPRYPNLTTAHDQWSFNSIGDCGEQGCLYRLDTDPAEHTDRAESMPELRAQMLANLANLNQSTFSPYRGPGEADKDVAAACMAAKDRYGGFFGPFLSL